MLLRPAKTKDRGAIRALVRLHPKQLVQDHVPATRDFFVAEENREIIGCCALEIYSRKIAEIRSLVVKKDFQGKGVATKLIKKCLERAKHNKVREILTITSGVDLFGKLGFKMFNKEKYALLKVIE